MTVESFHSPAAESRKKKIVVCCDGTGNEFGGPNPSPTNENAGQNSNVVKLYTALQIDNEQVAYYHPGVGTMGAPTATHWWSREWSKIKGLAFGAGFRDNVLDAYRYLMEVYNDHGGDGDEVYIFGFSRGAYTARALAGFLHGYGLLCRGNEGHIAYAWRMYVAQHEDRHHHSTQPDEAFKQTFSHNNFKIHFVGVWDTVSSVGWITTPMRLFNLSKNDTILRGRHAISIDEKRCFFQDNLWGDPEPHQDLQQVWFAGVHSDVGGSYPQPKSGLSDITLRWMLCEVGLHKGADGQYPDMPGIRLNEDRFNMVFGVMPEKAKEPELLYIPPQSSPLHNSLTWSWKVLEVIPHLYYSKDDDEEERRVPLGMRRRQLPDKSLVHESVVQRMETAKYEYAPKNVTRAELDRREDDLIPACADGTQYYCFRRSEKRTKRHWFLRFFDRFVVTWLFFFIDIVILLPLLIFLVLGVVGTATIVAVKLLTWSWWVVLKVIPGVVDIFGYWLGLLIGWLLTWLSWLLDIG